MDHGGEAVAPLSSVPPPVSSGPSGWTIFLLLLCSGAACGYVLERRYGIPVASRLRAALELARVLLAGLLRALLARVQGGASPALASGEESGGLLGVQVVEGGSVGVLSGSDLGKVGSVMGGLGSGGGGGGSGSGGAAGAGLGDGGSPLASRPLPAITGLPPASDGYRSLLSTEDLRQLLPHLPSRCMGKDLTLLFSSQRDGYSLSTLYTRARGSGPTLLVVLDDSQSVFGGFGSRDWSGAEYSSGGLGAGGGGGGGLPSSYARGSVGYMSSPHRRDLTGGAGAHFFGSGDAFLFALRPDFAVYRWTRVNNEFQLAREDLLAFGGGGGRFGLCLDANLEYGSTGPCETYGNPPLTPLGERFRMVRVELYGFKDAPLAGGVVGVVGSLAGKEVAKRAISLIQERRSSRANID